jgi:hypothetical protein
VPDFNRGDLNLGIFYMAVTAIAIAPIEKNSLPSFASFLFANRRSMVLASCFRRSSSEKENGFFGTGIVPTNETSSRDRERSCSTLLTGEVESRGADIAGIVVDTAARIMGETGPEDTLMSRVVTDHFKSRDP